MLQGWKGWLINKKAVQFLLSIYQEDLVCLHSCCQAAGALTHVHFLGFWEEKKNYCLVLLFLFHVGRGEWARETGNWSQGVNLRLCLAVLGVTQPWGGSVQPREGQTPTFGVHLHCPKTQLVQSPSGNLVGLPLGRGCCCLSPWLWEGCHCVFGQ